MDVNYSLYQAGFFYDFNLGFGHPLKMYAAHVKYRFCLKNPNISDIEKREFMLHHRRAVSFMMT